MGIGLGSVVFRPSGVVLIRISACWFWRFMDGQKLIWNFSLSKIALSSLWLVIVIFEGEMWRRLIRA